MMREELAKIRDKILNRFGVKKSLRYVEIVFKQSGDINELAEMLDKNNELIALADRGLWFILRPKNEKERVFWLKKINLLHELRSEIYKNFTRIHLKKTYIDDKITLTIEGNETEAISSYIVNLIKNSLGIKEKDIVFRKHYYVSTNRKK